MPSEEIHFTSMKSPENLIYSKSPVAISIESEEITCWEMLTRCCRKRKPKQLILSEYNFRALEREFEYVVEKLQIVKVPLLSCATQDDLLERLRYLEARDKSRKRNAKSFESNDDSLTSPFLHKYGTVFYLKGNSYPTVSEIYSRTKDSEVSPGGDMPSSSESKEKGKETYHNKEKKIQLSLSKHTLGSNIFALIPDSQNSSTPPHGRKQRTSGIREAIQKGSGDEGHPVGQVRTKDKYYSQWPTKQYIVAHMRSTQKDKSPSKDKMKHPIVRSSTSSHMIFQEGREEVHVHTDETIDVPGPSHQPNPNALQNTHISIPPNTVSVDFTQKAHASEVSTALSRLRPRGRESQSAPAVESAPGVQSLPSKRVTLQVPHPRPVSEPLEPQPSTSRGQPTAPSPKAAMSQINTATIESSSSDSGKSILSKKPSLRSLALSKDSDVLLEENKPDIEEDHSHKKVYVDVSGRSLPKTEVHKILNKYSSVFIENLKDPVPKDPLTLPKDDEENQPPGQVQSNQQPLVLQSSRKSISKALRNKGSHRTEQVPSSPRPDQQPRSTREANVRTEQQPTSSGRGAYTTIQSGGAEGKQQKRKESDTRKTENIQDSGRRLIQGHALINTPRTNDRIGQSTMEKKRAPVEQQLHEDDVSIELGCEDLHEHSSTSSQEFKEPSHSVQHRTFRPPKPDVYTMQTSYNDSFKSTTLPSTSGQLPAIHSPTCKKHATYKETNDDNKPCPSAEKDCKIVCTEQPPDSGTEGQNIGVVKRWKIIIKHHEYTDSDDSDDPPDDDTDK